MPSDLLHFSNILEFWSRYTNFQESKTSKPGSMFRFIRMAIGKYLLPVMPGRIRRKYEESTPTEKL